MANNIWSEFDKAINTEELQNEIKEAAENGGGNYKEVPVGKYEVAVEKMELVKSKKGGDPMVTIWFKVVGKDDPYKGCMIFMNQVITQGFQIHIVNELLRAMDTEFDVHFDTYSQYGNLLMDIHEAIDKKVEFALDYSENSKGYKVFEIEEVFDV